MKTIILRAVLDGAVSYLASLFRSPSGRGGPDGTDRFPACLQVVLHHEGGFVDDPNDPGGATNMGITHKTLAAWRGRAVTAEDVRNLTEHEASLIYRAEYWDRLRCGQLPAGVDLVVFDYGVNAGVSRSAMLLQGLVGAREDGVIGPKTIAAVRRQRPDELVQSFGGSRLRQYMSFSGWKHFGRGWSRRVDEVETEALKAVKA